MEPALSRRGRVPLLQPSPLHQGESGSFSSRCHPMEAEPIHHPTAALLSCLPLAEQTPSEAAQWAEIVEGLDLGVLIHGLAPLGAGRTGRRLATICRACARPSICHGKAPHQCRAAGRPSSAQPHGPSSRDRCRMGDTAEVYFGGTADGQSLLSPWVTGGMTTRCGGCGLLTFPSLSGHSQATSPADFPRPEEEG